MDILAASYDRTNIGRIKENSKVVMKGPFYFFVLINS